MKSEKVRLAMIRREFIELSAGIIGGLGIPGVIAGTANAAESESKKGVALDDSYLEKGLIGMARSEGWFHAHLGAAVLAGYYLCKENQLSEQTVAGIKKQLDTLIRINEPQFAKFSEMKADKSLIENVPAALAPAIEGGLRAHGHAVIYVSLSTRALHDAPDMADARLVQKLCGHIAQIAKLKPEVPQVPAEYADTQAMIEATFDSLVRFKPLLGYPTVRRPNFTHMTTHTEALMSLESMGYAELAKAGHLGHQAHIAAPVPEFDPVDQPLTETRVTLEEAMSNRYWESEENQRRWENRWDVKSNRNGYWVAFGHLFKVLYSYHRLIGHVKDKEQVRLCSNILLERYFNPDVQGG